MGGWCGSAILSLCEQLAGAIRFCGATYALPIGVAGCQMSAMFSYWRQSLTHFLGWFEHKRATTRYFYSKLFLFFVGLNLACYWLALLSIYPQHLASYKVDEYVLMGFPVGILGALFDSLSLFVTLVIVRHALVVTSNRAYVVYLSIDLVIAMAATLWVLFVFVASGWIVGLMLDRPETLDSRTLLYESRVWSALLNPFDADNMRNIWFGIVMGASALLPTLFHVYLAARSAVRSVVPTGHSRSRRP